MKHRATEPRPAASFFVLARRSLSQTSRATITGVVNFLAPSALAAAQMQSNKTAEETQELS
jgi:hypothetical protein